MPGRQRPATQAAAADLQAAVRRSLLQHGEIFEAELAADEIEQIGDDMIPAFLRVAMNVVDDCEQKDTGAAGGIEEGDFRF